MRNHPNSEINQTNLDLLIRLHQEPDDKTYAALFNNNIKLCGYYWGRFPHYHFDHVEEIYGYLFEVIKAHSLEFDPTRSSYFLYILTKLRGLLQRKYNYEGHLVHVPVRQVTGDESTVCIDSIPEPSAPDETDEPENPETITEGNQILTGYENSLKKPKDLRKLSIFRDWLDMGNYTAVAEKHKRSRQLIGSIVNEVTNKIKAFEKNKKAVEVI